MFGAAVTATVAFVISANYGGDNDPDAVAYLWAVGLGALMSARRRYPLIVLTVTVLGLFAYYAAGYPAIGVAVPVAAALYSAAEFGRLAWTVGMAVFVLATSVFFRLAEGDDFSLVVGYELAGHALLMAAAIALGDSVRSRRLATTSARRVIALTAERLRRDAETAVQAERVAIARDLHDSVGHATSVISLHADVAREAVGRDDAAAVGALIVIKNATATTMADLRRTVGLLRTPTDGTRTVSSLDNVDATFRAASRSGIEVTSDIRLARRLPPTVDTAAFRIVQESITNLVKHSTATRVHVEAVADDETLRLSIIDDGRSSTGAAFTPGHGVTGMRERAAAVGGTLEIGPGRDGFAVRAILPLGDEP